MKHKNVKVGQTVKVKNVTNRSWGGTFEPESSGLVGTVTYVNSLTDSSSLTVCVQFSDGCTDWGDHKDIKLVEDVV